MKKNTKILSALLGAFLLSTGSLAAQFPGDVYFVKPSVSVKPGGTARLDIQTFLGTNSLGAFHIEILFASAQLDVVKVVVNPDFADVAEAVVLPDKISIVGLNGRSLKEPIGTVDLATLYLKPKIPAGKRANLLIGVPDMLDAAGALITRRRGLRGSILVASPAPSSAGGGDGAGTEIPRRVVYGWTPLGESPPLAPLGGSFIHYEPVRFEGRWIAMPVRIDLIDPRLLGLDLPGGAR